MKITRIDIFELNITLTQSLKTTLGGIDAAQNVAIRLETDTGLIGWGEAAPYAPVTGERQKGACIAASDFAHIVLSRDPRSYRSILRDLFAASSEDRSVISAFDLALHDLAAQSAQMPLWQFLGGDKITLATGCTIGLLPEVEATRARAKELAEAGFKAIKLKIGRSGSADLEHIKTVRNAIGPGIKLRCDANQAWNYADAVSIIHQAEPYDLDYMEQPLPAWNKADHKRLRSNCRMPICADESMFNDKDAQDLISSGAVDYLNIKLAKCGGLENASRINAIAEAAGAPCMIGCFTESRLALSAAAALCAAYPNIKFIDLDALYYHRDDPVRGGASFGSDGAIELSDDIGLGAEFDEEALTHFATVQ